MNKGKDDLFRLIQSMSKTEKRYFKMESKKAGAKTSNHVKLFDAINNLEEYDEELLKKKLKKEKLIKHLSAEKRYLYQAVLRSIRNFRSDQSIFARIKALVLDADYLLARSLYDQAEKRLDKASILATKIDDTISLLEINLKKQRLSIVQKTKKHQQEIELLMKQKDEIIQLLLTKLELRDIYNKVGVSLVKDNQNQISDLINGKESFLEQAKHLDSFYANMWYYSIKARYYTGIGELDTLIEIRSKIVTLWEQHPVIKDEFLYQYLIDLNNISAAFSQHNQMEKSFEYLKMLENEKPRNSFDRVYIFEKVTIKKLIRFMSSGDFDKAELLIPGIESALKKYPIKKSSITTIKSNIATLYFCKEEFNLCLAWASKIINDSKSNIRLDLQRKARLLTFFAYIELENNFESIDNLYRSTHRYFVKNDLKANIDVELILLDYLWKYQNSIKNQQNNIVSQFKLAIEGFQNHQTKRLTPGLEEFHFWSRSKLEKKPIAVLIKESYRTRNKN
jgi:hypothetical protein